MFRLAKWGLTLVAVACTGCVLLLRGAGEPDIQGGWQVDKYILKNGTQHSVKGLIFFSERDWVVLFFIATGGQPQRGDAEGGTYTLKGKKLVLRHLYQLSGGKILPGVPGNPPHMEVNGAATAPIEPCTVELKRDQLTIYFPSGNLMTFRRSAVS